MMTDVGYDRLLMDLLDEPRFHLAENRPDDLAVLGTTVEPVEMGPPSTFVFLIRAEGVAHVIVDDDYEPVFELRRPERVFAGDTWTMIVFAES